MAHFINILILKFPIAINQLWWNEFVGQMQCCDWLICRSTLSVFANCGANVIDGSENQNKRNVEVILTLNWTI